MSESSSATRMTDGPIWKRLIAFAVPLFWGNLFQQLYNTADSLIVGNFSRQQRAGGSQLLGKSDFFCWWAFSTASPSAPVWVTAKYFGEENKEQLEKSIYTTVAFGLVCGVVLTVVGIVAAPRILILMGTPAGSAAGVSVLFPGLLCRIHRLCHVQFLRGNPAGHGRQQASAVFPDYLICD